MRAMVDREGLAEMVPAGRFAVPDDLPELFLRYARSMGASEACLYLADYEQRLLRPLPRPGASPVDGLVIDATLAGRCYRKLQVEQVVLDGGGRRVWVPVLDGSERLGVFEIVFPHGVGQDIDEDVRLFAGLAAELVVAKNAYGDLFELVRRPRPMSLAAELARQQLPPLTFACEDLVITGLLFPVYELGGDTFDYAVDAHTARFAIFDAMGHGLEAGLMASVAVAAYRNTRRRGLELADTVSAIDGTITSHFKGAFVTGVVCELELVTGYLRWFVAGHPRPLLLRGGRVVKTLEGRPGRPFGLGAQARIAEEALEPADRILLFTDGVVEARSESGEFFGDARLADFVIRASASTASPPETMRQLVHSILQHQQGNLQDDAATILVQWRGEGRHHFEISSAADSEAIGASQHGSTAGPAAPGPASIGGEAGSSRGS